MSTRTDFFVATTGEVMTMLLPQPPPLAGPKVTVYEVGPDGKLPPLTPLFPDHPCVASKNILPDDVADLDFVLTGNRDREPDFIGSEQQEETGAYRLDRELVEALAEMKDDRLEEIADEWSISDIPSSVELLKDLRNLAQEALKRDEEMFLYLYV